MADSGSAVGGDRSGWTDLDWMRLHSSSLFLDDDKGRMAVLNVGERSPAPCFYLGRTLEGNIWRIRRDLSSGLARQLGEILESEPVATDLPGQAVTIRRLYLALIRHEPVQWMWEGPAWRFPDRIEPPRTVRPESLTAASDVGDGHFAWLAEEIDFIQPVFVVRDGGHIVSICHSSRYLPSAAQAGVETLESYRGRGYGFAVVSSWARAVRAEGREPLYSTHRENHASRALAARLGLILIGDDLHMM